MKSVIGMAGVLLLSALLAPSIADARGSGGHSGGHSSSHSYSHSSGRLSSHAVPSVPRDSHGRIARSPAARSDFQRSNPCPSTGKTSGACRGYVVDHVTPLKRGGADSPSNMQWQTKEAAKIKDKTE